MMQILHVLKFIESVILLEFHATEAYVSLDHDQNEIQNQ
jgi:hypothetical protein